jgi:hypothetical protein
MMNVTSLKKGYRHDFGFACEQEAEARWLHFWTVEVTNGEE